MNLPPPLSPAKIAIYSSQLGHDCVNELTIRGHEVVGSDIAEQYSGVNDGSAVTKAPYVQLDITDRMGVKD